MGFMAELARRNWHNLRTLRQSPAAEISGALGDLGTLLPLMIALALQGSIDLPATLVFSGLFNITTGVVFGIPLPVQPMKAIAASALATNLPLPETTAAGALVSLAVLFLSVTGLLQFLATHIPVPIIKGIQLGAGLRLAISGAHLILPLAWLTPLLNSRLSTILAFLVLFLTQHYPRFPYALLLFGFALLTTPLSTPIAEVGVSSVSTTSTLSPPFLHPPSFTPTSLSLALAQLPLTLLNSILAVTSLSDSLFPASSHPSLHTTSTTTSSSLSTTALGFSVATMNILSSPFGAMPVCHGAGGLAAQHRFGARSGASVVLLGLVKMVVGATVGFTSGRGGGEGVLDWLQGFPRGVLGVMVVAAGLELGKVGGMREGGGNGDEEGWVVTMVTAVGILGFGNDAVGFLAGGCCWGSYRVREWLERRRGVVVVGERRPLLW